MPFGLRAGGGLVEEGRRHVVGRNRGDNAACAGATLSYGVAVVAVGSGVFDELGNGSEGAYVHWGELNVYFDAWVA